MKWVTFQYHLKITLKVGIDRDKRNIITSLHWIHSFIKKSNDL